MASANPSTLAPVINPQDPASWLKPDDTLMAGGFDWSWCYARFSPVPNWPDLRADVTGAIWSCRGIYRNTTPWYRKRQYQKTDGHMVVHVKTDNKLRVLLVHRLILEAFVGPCLPGMECCHGDGNPTNNRLWNLRWDTRSANMFDRGRHGTLCIGSRNFNAKLTEGDVPKIFRLRDQGTTQPEIARRFGVSTNLIWRVLAGRSWRHVTQR